MALHPLIRPLGLIFTLSGLAQGLLWFVGSILCILLYNGSIEPSTELSHSTLIFRCWYITFFKGELDFAITVTNHVFFGFAVLYLILSIWWMLTSTYLFYYMRLKRWNPIKHVLIAHCIVVTFISIIDLAFMSLLADDYHAIAKIYDDHLDKISNALEGPSASILSYVYVLTVIGIMIMIAVRGIVLWFFNVISIFYALFLICQQLENERLPTILYNIPIDAYNEYPSFENPTTNAYENNGYLPENESHWETTPKSLAATMQNFSDFARRTNLMRSDSNPKANKPPLPPPKPKKDPPIPFPDYSPPQTPKNLRSAIKKNSSYY